MKKQKIYIKILSIAIFISLAITAIPSESYAGFWSYDSKPEKKYTYITEQEENRRKALLDEYLVGYAKRLVKAYFARENSDEKVNEVREIGKKGIQAKQISTFKLMESVKSGNRRVRLEAIKSLGKIGQSAKKSVPSLMNVVNDRKQRAKVRREAALALRKIGSSKGRRVADSYLNQKTPSNTRSTQNQNSYSSTGNEQTGNVNRSSFSHKKDTTKQAAYKSGKNRTAFIKREDLKDLKKKSSYKSNRKRSSFSRNRDRRSNASATKTQKGSIEKQSANEKKKKHRYSNRRRSRTKR